jgi:Predicted membrane protein (DUF2142)
MMPGFLRAEATYRTRSLQLAVVAITALAALFLAAHALWSERDRLTYTNNVPSKVVLANIRSDERMCREEVLLPKDSKEVQLLVLTNGQAGPPLHMTLRGPSGTIRSTLAAGYGDGVAQTFRIPAVRETISPRMCVTNGGTTEVAFGGVSWATARGSIVTAKGEKVAGDLAINVRSGRKALIDVAPDAMRRAAVWAPPWAGAWTFWLLFALGLAMTAVAVRLVLVRGKQEAAAGRRRAGLPRAAWTIAVLAFLNGFAFSLLILPWQGPDEISHFAYVQHLATAGDLKPATGPLARTYSTEHQYAMEQSFTNTVRSNPVAKPPWEQEARDRWKALDERNDPPASDGGAPTGYTPEYYAAASAGYYAFAWGDVFDRQFGARLVSGLLGALSVIFVWLFARELFRREDWLPATAALSVALLPQFGFIGGIVNNDSLAITLGSLELYLLARWLGRGPTTRLAVGIGLVLALAYLAKPSMSAFGPIVAGALAWPLIRDRDRRRALLPLAGLAGFVAVALVWIGIAALADRGVSTVSTANTRAFSLSDFLSYTYHFYLPSLPGRADRWFGSQSPVYTVWMHSFFATFGSTDTLFPERVYKVLTAICIGAAGLLGVAFWRERAAVRRALPTIVMAAAATVTLIVFVHVTFYLFYAGYPGEQGRYLLPLVPVFGAAVAASTLALGRRWAPLLAAFYVTALGFFTVFSYGLVITRYYV